MNLATLWLNINLYDFASNNPSPGELVLVRTRTSSPGRAHMGWCPIILIREKIQYLSLHVAERSDPYTSRAAQADLKSMKTTEIVSLNLANMSAARSQTGEKNN